MGGVGLFLVADRRSAAGERTAGASRAAPAWPAAGARGVVRVLALGVTLGLAALAGPTAAVQAEADVWRLDLADGAVASVEPPEVRAEGGVSFSFRDLRVVAERAVYDDRERVVRFYGSVRAERPGQVLEGQAARVDLGTGRVEVEQALGRFEAEGVADPVFVQAARLEGSPQRLEAAGAVLTTCPLPIDHAHYRVTVKRLEVRPGEEVAAYHAVFWESGVPVFYWPYLHFSLKNPRAGRFVPPEVGYGAREGWFVKARFPYMGPGSAYGYVDVDYFERLGPGLGLYQALYDDGRSWVAVYAGGTLRGPQGFPPYLRAGLEGQLVAGGGSLALQAEASRRESEGELRYLGRASVGGSVPEWGFSLSSQSQGYVPADGDPGPLQGVAVGELKLERPVADRWRLSAAGRWDLDSGAFGRPPSEAWDLSARVAARVGEGEVALAASHTTHPDLFADPAARTDWRHVTALPELTARWPLARSEGPVPARVEAKAGIGRFVEVRPAIGGGAEGPDERVSDARAQAGLQLSAGPVRLGAWQLDGTAAVSAAAYGSGDRQLVLDTSASARWPVGRRFYVQGSYELQAPLAAGASPFQFDRAEYRERVTLLGVAGEGGPLRLSLRSTYDVATGRWGLTTASVLAQAGGLETGLTAGYDVGMARWEAVVGRVAWRSEGARAELAARYRPEQRAFDQVAASASWDLPGRLTMRLGGQYQPVTQRLQRADVSLAWRALPEWVVSVNGSWDVRLGGLVGGSVGIALDQDCRAIALRYDPVNRRAALAYQIKAFPESAVALGALRPGSLTEEAEWQQLLQGLEEPLRP